MHKSSINIVLINLSRKHIWRGNENFLWNYKINDVLLWFRWIKIYQRTRKYNFIYIFRLGVDSLI